MRTREKTLFCYLESDISKAIYIMSLATKYFDIGHNSMAYRMMDWALKRYGLDNHGGYKMKMDIINGYL